MTRTAKRALKQVGVPAVRLHASGQFFARIGYRESTSGARQRAFFYLGRDEKSAVAKAASLKHEWREIKRRDGTHAVWPIGANVAPSRIMAKLSPQRIHAAIEKHHVDMAENAVDLGIGEQRDGVVEQMPTLRLEQVRDLYNEYRKGKIGVGGGQGLKQSTYTDSANNLKLALRDVDERMTINALGYAEIETWKDAVFRRVGNGMTARTAVNYMRAVKGMLDWSHTRADIPYRHPEDVANLFRFKKFTPINVAEYDAKQLKTLLKSASDREKLYVYLAMNCGHTQADIGMLRADEIQQRDGKTVIVRRREKTSHQNDFESLHVLWDETAKLLARQMAKPNPFGRALLNEAHRPLYRREDGGKYDGVNQAYYGLADRSGVKLSFKQFRKIGATAIQRIGGDEARRLYKAGTIDSGDKVYVREAWEKLTPPLMVWADQLRRDGVLVAPDPSHAN